MKLKNYLIILGLIIIGIFLFARSCNITDKYSELKGKYLTLAEQSRQEQERTSAVIAKQGIFIQKLDKQIEETNRTIEQKNEQVAKGKIKIKELEKIYPSLKDKDAMIENLLLQVEAWKGEFSLSQDIIVEKDKIIFSLTQKYEASVIISDSWKAGYEAEVAAHLACRDALGALEGKYKRARFSGSVKTILIGAAVGYIGYRVLAK